MAQIWQEEVWNQIAGETNADVVNTDEGPNTESELGNSDDRTSRTALISETQKSAKVS